MGPTFISWCYFAALLLPATQVLAAAAAGFENGMAAPLMPRQEPGEGGCGAGIGSCTDGQCCSEYGYCGDTSEFCGTGCQPMYGNCGSAGQSSGGSMTSHQSASVVTVTRSGCTTTYGM